MAVPLGDVVAYLDELLQVAAYTEEEPSNGLMVDAGQPVDRIGAAVNTSFASIRGAAEAGAQFLFVHHTTWASIDLHLKDEKEQALRDAGVSLYGAHAALDSARDVGNADSLARLLGVEVEGRLVKWAGGYAGIHGRADGTFEQFVERAREVLGVPVDAWRNNDTFGRVAIVTGAGLWTSMLEEARSAGCDTYLTGEIAMYTKLYARETGLNLVAGTHYATESFGVQRVAERAADHFGISWSFIHEDPDIL